MATYQLTIEAQNDLQDIAYYSFETFGLTQADKDGEGLRDCFSFLADNPRIGRDVGFIRNNTRRYEYQSHSIYYQITGYGVLVLRVLHNRMDAGRLL